MHALTKDSCFMTPVKQKSQSIPTDVKFRTKRELSRHCMGQSDHMRVLSVGPAQDTIRICYMQRAMCFFR